MVQQNAPTVADKQTAQLVLTLIKKLTHLLAVANVGLPGLVEIKALSIVLRQKLKSSVLTEQQRKILVLLNAFIKIVKISIIKNTNEGDKDNLTVKRVVLELKGISILLRQALSNALLGVYV